MQHKNFFNSNIRSDEIETKLTQLIIIVEVAQCLIQYWDRDSSSGRD